MIDKLRKKIFWILQLSLTSIIVGIILLYSVLTYKNTINSATMMADRFIGGDEMFKNVRIEEELTEDNLEGLYMFSIDSNLRIIKKDNKANAEIEDVVVRASKKNAESGIIGNYIYKIRKIRNNEKRITLIENEDIVSHTKLMFYFSILSGVISIIIIYIIAKKVSKTIVKPVEDTMEKQKQFISDASHELKTPLAVIEANTDVIAGDIGANKWIKYIQNEIESMNKLLNELLLLAKMESKISKDYIEFNLSNEIEIITSVFESMAYEKQVLLNTNIQKNINFYGDKEDIKHILSILIDNAIKHTNKSIAVELEKEKNEIKIQVKNEGEPIPKEEQERIFERFYRVDKSRNRNEKRYGLGLSIAKQIVENYNGTIEVNCSDNVTNFIVKIIV